MLANKRSDQKELGQAMVEFALTLPIVLTIVFGVIEFGFLLWSYSSVNSAAREAARYGIAIGDGNFSGQRYYDCDGIRDAALKAGYFAGMQASDVYIEYDSGPNTARKYNTCEELALEAGDDEIVFGDRIVVSVTHDYQPIAALMGVNIQPFNMIARANRTIVKSAELIKSEAPPGGTGNQVACFTLLTGHTGDGSDPSISPVKSSECAGIGEFVGGEDIILSASPNMGWSVGSWTNTDNDASQSTTNTLNMPGAPYTAVVNYVNTTPICYSLSRSILGTGAGTLTASPTNSDGCAVNTYTSGEVIALTAAPDLGSELVAWSGTTDDSSTEFSNSITMPASNHTVGVQFSLTSPICYSLNVSHTGIGTEPAPSAANCAGGMYVENTVVTLNATPGIGYEIGSWGNTDDDASTATTNTVTMTSDINVSVNYVLSTNPAPPVNVEVPNGVDEWKWNSGLKACQKIDLRWFPNPSWGSDAPIYYNVYKDDSFYTTINGWYWDANFSILQSQIITLKVEAVFAGGVTSDRYWVKYLCFDENELKHWGQGVD